MKYTCPSCGYKVFDEPSGSYSICPICFWEDDYVQNNDPLYRGGANTVSLYEAQQNYIKYGVSELRFKNKVRSPNEDDILDTTWIPYKKIERRKGKVVIDLSGIESIEMLHQKLKVSLGFPDFYGMNWDAFWDSISGIIEMPETIEFIDWYEFEIKFFKESRIIKDLFDELEDEYPYNSSKVIYK